MKLSCYLALIFITVCTVSHTQNNPEINNKHHYSARPPSHHFYEPATISGIATDRENVPPLLEPKVTIDPKLTDIAILASRCSLSTDNVPPLLGQTTTTPSTSTSFSTYSITQSQVVASTPIVPSAHESTPAIAGPSFLVQPKNREFSHLQTCAVVQGASEYTPNSYPQSTALTPQPATPPASSTQSHTKLQHSQNAREKQFKCTYKECTKTFTRKANRDRHMRIHTRERPFKCTTCNKPFRHQGALKRHMRTHTRERPHKCTLCGKAFTQKYNLTRHLESKAHKDNTSS